MKSSIIFVYSKNIDTYINVLSFMHERLGIDRFSFAAITGGGADGASPSAAIHDILYKLEELAEGRYVGQGPPKEIEIQGVWRDHYRTIANKINSTPEPKRFMSIPLDELARHLHGNAIDATALPKLAATRVVMLCLEHNIDLYTFDLKNLKKRPEDRLFHSLEEGEFEYSNQTRDPYVQASMGRSIPVRQIRLIATVLAIIGVACFTILLFFDVQTFTLGLIGLIANILGITGTTYQLLSSRFRRFRKG